MRVVYMSGDLPVLQFMVLVLLRYRAWITMGGVLGKLLEHSTIALVLGRALLVRSSSRARMSRISQCGDLSVMKEVPVLDIALVRDVMQRAARPVHAARAM